MKKSILYIAAGFFLTVSSVEAISLNFIKRLGKQCTGVCDQPSLVCGKDKKQIEWCKKNCSHKIKIEDVCKKASATPVSKPKCSQKTPNESLVHATAAVAAKYAYEFGEKGGHKSPDFKEVGHLKDKKTELVAWAGIRDCVLYVAYRGTVNKGDVVKDLQIGVAHLAGKVGLAGFASRGAYNNVVNAGVDFYHKMVKKASGQFSRTVITGHSLGGGIAMNVGTRVNPNEVVTLNAPGTDFLSPKSLSGSTTTTHIRSPGDVVSKWGTRTEGETVKTRGGSKNPLKAHGSAQIKKELEKKAKKAVK